ncbi:MAG: hypothetical protein J6V03_03095, partial [Clostridia bacterium]|nr:hypothetical protein [Clostridia bacterium]
SDYYGQSKTAYSDITVYNPELKTATMDLSEAYARDATSASRKISLDGKKLVIEDSITLKKQSNIYWNWYVQVKNDKNDKTFTAGNIEIFTDGEYEYAIVTRNGKKFKVSFETDSPYSLKVQKAEYYVNVDPDPNGTKHSFETSRRLAVQFENVSGTVNLKTIVESMD